MANVATLIAQVNQAKAKVVFQAQLLETTPKSKIALANLLAAVRHHKSLLSKEVVP